MKRSALSRPLRMLQVAAITSAALAAWPAQAALDQWGAWASGTARECPAGLCSGSAVETAADGSFGSSSAAVAMSPGATAAHPGVDFQAQATFGGALDLPVLRALAAADTSARYTVDATAQAVQAYVYTGSGSTNYALDVFVDGTATGFATLSGFVSVYDAEGYNPNSELIGTRLANTFFSWNATGPNLQPAALNFILEPGDEIYLTASLFAGTDSRALTPGVADAFHTMTMGFRDSTGLVTAAAAVVPEPSSWALMACGLVGLAWRRGVRR